MKKRSRKQHRGGLAPDKYLSVVEQRKLIAYLDRRYATAINRGTHRAITNRFIVELLLKSGMRAEDLQDLKIRDLPVYHSKQALYVRDGKGDVARTVVISQALCDSIIDYVKMCRKNAKAGSYLVVNERGGRLSYRSLYSKLSRIGRLAGLIRLAPHMLRHSYSCNLYRDNKDLRFLQMQLGHSNINTTSIYQHTESDEGVEQVEKMEQNFSRNIQQL